MHTVLRWLSHRSLGVLHALGAVLGWAGYAFSAGYRRRLRANAALAGIGSADRHAAVAHAGRMVAELPRQWLWPRSRPIEPDVQWQQAELIERALDAGRGLMILTPHLGAFEVLGQAYAERFGARQPMTALYRPAKQAWLRELEATARDRPGLLTAPASLAGVRQMIRVLRQGQTVGLLPDQVPPEGMGVWAPFFGQPAYTMTLATRLARQTGAALGLLWAERLPRGAGFVVHVRPVPPLPEPADEVADAGAINRIMEATICEGPGQYLWGYHRYKAPRAV